MTLYILIGVCVILACAIAILVLVIINANKSREQTQLALIRQQESLREVLQAVTQQNAENALDYQQTLTSSLLQFSDSVTGRVDKIADAQAASATAQTQAASALKETLTATLHDSSTSQLTSLNATREALSTAINQLSADQTASLAAMKDELTKSVTTMSTAQTDRLNSMERTITVQLGTSLEKIQQTTDARLTSIQDNVNSKLDTALNERLDSSFTKIADQLAELYKSLGELGKMQSSISDLNRTLSNVKTRGTWGEAQLRDIIRETMVPTQYEENVVTKRGSTDRVEFAIKIPSKNDSSQFILMPIDSKFPMDIYGSVVDAAQAGDPAKLDQARKALEQRIKDEARKIRDKYISVPATTNFAIMYLPTESLYAEVLRINGLAEYCQNTCKIVISGPTTITALLNSLRVGFENLTLSKKTEEVGRLLQAIKQQFDKLDEMIDDTQRKLDAASTSNSKLKTRTAQIQRRMRTVSGELTPAQADAILELPESDGAQE